MGTRVVCTGDSITRGQVSVNYVRMLANRIPGLTFTGAGVNRDLAYNLLQRLDAIVNQQPDIVTVLIGTNDARASVSDAVARALMKKKRLPVYPTLGWFRENLVAIVDRLRNQTNAEIALLSPPVLGEAPNSHEAHASGEVGAIVKATATEFGLTYLPLHERQLEHLRAAGNKPRVAYPETNALRNKIIALRLLGQSFDDISRRHGLELTTDHIHQNSRGAAMIADLIQTFVTQHAEMTGQ